MAKRNNRNGTHSLDHAGEAARKTLNRAVLAAIAIDFERRGNKAITWLREERPFEYLKLVAALLPKEFRKVLPQELRSQESPLDEMSDEEFFTVLNAIRAAVAEREKEEAGAGSPAAQEPGTPRH